LLVSVEPETCHPANCGGRIDGDEGSVAAGEPPAKAAPKPHNNRIRTDMNLVTMRTTGADAGSPCNT
jgi:hypothetical protein